MFAIWCVAHKRKSIFSSGNVKCVFIHIDREKEKMAKVLMMGSRNGRRLCVENIKEPESWNPPKKEERKKKRVIK